MVTKRQCSFCAEEIEPGTGTIFVKRDGTVYQFCSSSCRKQQLHLGRIGHRFKWTRAYELKRSAERSSAERGVPAPAAPRVRDARPAPAKAAPAAPATTPARPAGGPVPQPRPKAGAPSKDATPAAPSPPPKKPRPRRGGKPSAKPTDPDAEPSAPAADR